MAEPEELNGLKLADLEAALGEIKADPHKAQTYRWSARARWAGGFKSKVTARDHQFVVDEPAGFASVDEAPTAVEYVLGAFGACLATGFVYNATKRGIELYNMEVSLEGRTDNVLTFLGLSEDGHAGYREISAKLYVQADADEAALREVWEQTVKTSPVGNSLARVVSLKPELAVM
jgi:uncharacterized OsmC-like protein